jgi:hypothetical protein
MFFRSPLFHSGKIRAKALPSPWYLEVARNTWAWVRWQHELKGEEGFFSPPRARREGADAFSIMGRTRRGVPLLARGRADLRAHVTRRRLGSAARPSGGVLSRGAVPAPPLSPLGDASVKAAPLAPAEVSASSRLPVLCAKAL